MSNSIKKLYPEYPINFNKGKSENLSTQHR